jgi:hypothetical protein
MGNWRAPQWTGITGFPQEEEEEEEEEEVVTGSEGMAVW